MQNNFKHSLFENNSQKSLLVTSAFMLHRRPFRETSIIADFFTLNYGKVSVIAKGIRKDKHNKNGLLTAFNSVHIELKGKHELQNLVNIESNATPIILHNQSLYYGLYVNELLYRLLHKHDTHKELYVNYENFLSNLAYNAKNKQQKQWLLCLFQNKLLQEIGYGLHWNLDYNNQEIQTNRKYFFVYEHGFIDENNIPQHLKFTLNKNLICQGNSLLTLYNQENFFDIQKFVPTLQTIQEITNIFNYIFQHLLGKKHSSYLL